MRESVFILALAIAAGTLLMVVRTIAGAFTGQKSNANLAQLRDQVDQQAAALEYAEQNLAQQATQIAELQERLDFTERLMTQKDRSALGPGDPRP